MSITPAPTPRDAGAIARILKVNHAGEYGAIRIYSAQLLVATIFSPDAVPALSRMLVHEREHCAAFRAAMPARNSRPCRVMKLWSCGGWMLGFITALLGRQGIWACTAAVEAAVHRHLEDQLRFLVARDRQLHEIIASIQEEELSHLRHAESNLNSPSAALGFLRLVISCITDALIFLSTWGDSARMGRDLRATRS
ncbi:MAG: demethoxyubiquinone hydroxylase family protein [Hyphomicrobiales bacterium]|nr:demethoxyubiquinone hydroxylase family protein [Hyphomicrobiales bacterium]MBV9739697.1 demethoxyubiquinone hydroxylase family protein [Hyphomicrobiales bacterium]